VRVVDLGTFLIPVRLSLAALMDGGRDEVVAALQTTFSEFATAEPVESSEVLLDYHRSIGARQTELALFAGSRLIDGLGLVQLHLSSLSIGFVMIELDLPDGTVIDLESTGAREGFKAHEAVAAQLVSPYVAEWAERVARCLPAHLVGPRPEAALPASRLLWWHRIAVDPALGEEFPATRWYGESADLADGARVTVANGFTSVLTAPPGARYARRHLLSDVVEGLIVATQEWVVVDEAKRLLASHLVRLSGNRRAGVVSVVSVDAQYYEVLKLTEEITLRNLVLHEEARYLANARGLVRQAAARVWRMADEAADLDQRIGALRDLFTLHRERIFNDRDDRRNRLVFVFTVLTLIQSVLFGYDFLTGNATVVGPSPRPAIAIAVLALTVLTLVGALLGQPYLERLQHRLNRRR